MMAASELEAGWHSLWTVGMLGGEGMQFCLRIFLKPSPLWMGGSVLVLMTPMRGAGVVKPESKKAKIRWMVPGPCFLKVFFRLNNVLPLGSLF